jgi:hypothetical protein
MTKNKIYLGKRILTDPFGEEFIWICIGAKRVALEKAGLEVEEVDGEVAMKRAYKILEEFQNE